MQNHKYIILEGGECSGKSTQMDLLRSYLEQQFASVLVTLEPGGCALSEHLRELALSHNSEATEQARLFLMLAARAQLVETVIQPWLAAQPNSAIVLSDRGYPATMVYQGYVAKVMGDNLQYWESLSSIPVRGLPKATVIYIDLEGDEVERRLKNRSESNRNDLRGADFHHAVGDGYRLCATACGWLQVDGFGTEREVHQRIIDAIKPRLVG